MVLLAIAASFFINRLCTEVGRIIIDAQEGQREKEITTIASDASKEKKQEKVIQNLGKSEEETATEKEKEEKASKIRKRKSQEAIGLIAGCLDSFAFYYYV